MAWGWGGWKDWAEGHAGAEGREMLGLGRGQARNVVIVIADGDLELSLTVPITNSLAFLFTVLGEWWAEGKVISRGQCLFFFGQWQLSKMFPG